MQVITGLAILLSGFIAVRDERAPLIASDWAVVVYLAWFSAATHLAGLTTLRGYLGCRPKTKALRIAAMFLLLVSLIIGLVPTGCFNWSTHFPKSEYTAALPKSPALCYFSVTVAQDMWDVHFISNTFNLWSDEPPSDRVESTKAMQGMAGGVLFLMYGFTTRCVKLSPQLARVFIIWIRLPIGKRIQYIMTAVTQHSFQHEFGNHIWTDVVMFRVWGFTSTFRLSLDCTRPC